MGETSHPDSVMPSCTGVTCNMTSELMMASCVHMSCHVTSSKLLCRGLLYCMEYLEESLADWLGDELQVSQ